MHLIRIPTTHWDSALTLPAPHIRGLPNVWVCVFVSVCGLGFTLHSWMMFWVLSSFAQHHSFAWATDWNLSHSHLGHYVLRQMLFIWAVWQDCTCFSFLSCELAGNFFVSRSLCFTSPPPLTLSAPQKQDKRSWNQYIYPLEAKNVGGMIIVLYRTGQNYQITK